MLHDRKHIRLRDFDYASDGWYFVTICTQNREFYFGEIANQQMVLTGIGEIARQLWTEIPVHFPGTELGEFVVMPNHVHGIIGIHHRRDVACNIPTCNIPTTDDIPTKNEYMASISPKPGTLSAMIRSYKSAVTKRCHDNHISNFGWQSRFHDHIIRDQDEFDRIERYIMENIANWETDKFFV
jgi:REP element-mobilizing transposase RayT